MEKMNGEGLSIKDVNIEKLKEIFPECVVEEKIDFEMLKLLLGEKAEIKEDSYRFTWEGKSDAIKIAREASNATLRPEKEKSVNWDKTENLYIEGDNLEALKALTKTYYGKVKMIYIDPPYNTGNDFVYNDDFAESNNKYVFETNQAFRANPETSGKYHRNWLNMMYPRLQVAKQLLSDDGVIFISIDDNEQTNLKKICDEIFGENNFIANLIVISAPAGTQSSIDFATQQSYCLVYRKSNVFSANTIKLNNKELKEKYSYGSDILGNYYIERLWKRGIGGRMEDVPSLHFPIWYNPESNTILIDDEFSCTEQGYIKIIPYQSVGVLGRWTWSKEKMKNERNKLIVVKIAGEYKLHKKVYDFEDKGKVPYTIIDSKIGRTELGSLEVKNTLGGKYFDYPKSSDFIKHLLKIAVDKNSIVLDFFSGSATTAHAVMQLNAEDGGNRKFIMVQLPEVCDEKSEAYKAGYKTICEIGEERIRRAAKKIYEEAVEKKEKAGLLASEVADPDSLDLGFKVFRVDSTNLRAWDSTKQYDEESLFDLIEVVKEGRTELDLVYEIMLKQGVFNMPLEVKKINDKNVYTVADNYLVIFLADDITTEDILEIAKMKPKSVVFKEKGFKNDNDKLNADYTFKRLNVDSIMCL